MQSQPHPVEVNLSKNRNQRENEISLIDIWLLIVKRKRLFWITFFIVFVAGLVFTLLRPTINHEITSVIEIGHIIRNGELTPLESPETTMAKLKNAFLPKVLEEYETKIPLTNFSIPRESNLVIMSTKSEVSNINQVKKFHSELSRLLRSEHNRLIRPYRLRLEADINIAKIELENLQDSRLVDAEKKALDLELEKANTELTKLREPVIQKLMRKMLEIELDKAKNNYSRFKDEEITLQAKYQSLDKTKQLLESQISELKNQLKKTVALLQKKSTENTNNSDQAMAILMLGNEVQQNRNRLSSLEEKLYITLDNQRVELYQLIEENKRMQLQQSKIIEEKKINTEKYWVVNKMEQTQKMAVINKITAQIKKLTAAQEQAIKTRKQAISTLEGELKNLIDTQITTPPVDSGKFNPSSNKKLILVLTLMIGLMLALFSTIIMEFLEKARERERSAYSG